MVFSSMVRGASATVIAFSFLPIVSCVLQDPTVVKGAYIVEFNVAESTSVSLDSFIAKQSFLNIRSADS